MLYVVLAALLLFALAFSVRRRIRYRPGPQGRPGESPQEAHMLLLGTYRLYSWLIWANLGVNVLGLMGGEQIRTSLWFGVPAVLVTVALLWAASALYWRLGYDPQPRWVLVLGHLSILFALTEYFMAISSDMFAYMDKHNKGQGFSL